MLAAVLFAVSVAAATPIPLDDAKHAFDEARLASDEDGGKLWGRALYGPMIFVDPNTRYAVANQSDEKADLKLCNGVYTGYLPKNVVVANTATEWNGVKWTMVAWPFGSSPVSRRRLLLHESFHRIQSDIGFAAREGNNSHLDTLDGRYWFLLELRALARALRDENRNEAIADALAFRAMRRSLFANSDAAETALEDNEGIAEYTGYALRGTGAEETRLLFARLLDRIDRKDSFVRGFAYSSGPAYGLLLDVASPGWTHNFKRGDDLATTLALAAKIKASENADARSNVYAGATLRSEEEKRDRDHRELLAKYRARLVDGPVIEVPMGAYGFDPNAVTSLGKEGNAYSELEVTGEWGTFHVTTGARISSDYSAIFISASDRDKLVLKPGWKIVAGARAGDLRVTRE
jgi:hypothetical protein